ncbi:MAG TPA: NAD(P)H-dependent glycerol-3-phosphate dehydrogenase [Bacillota bacterium]|nr:NAD(P)H-dependent glycerol-3-phosphate dehydrogenase [Bacillota bacterium]HOJ83410.1 NAD(P)H-dependent glycerol-3-phosphate dehydrogenase [Bacillota bacterium]HOL14653.1 NAD(P)H-dependent glycerol-3-phosphate dehydrogenase [Bacillota bacterium]HPZ11075.1 NAD(P)H-dependent glycerol-3-phosphate dehydrogenase [Bacillota bacterium]HQE09715.1 NAD(P)H-dependent glycerol-3-phosphate dehydrogenase [Bacillota bacterium]
MEAAVVGAGGWGTALAVLLADKGCRVSFWMRSQDVYRKIILKRVNEDYLPGVRLGETIRPTVELEEALRGKELVIFAVPSHGLRAVAAAAAPYLPPRAVIVNAAKGLEDPRRLRLSQVLREELPETLHGRIAVISGPNHAEEVSRGLPSATVAASMVAETARQVQEMLMTPYFRVYTNPDLVGVELGGALKNVIAIGAGIVEGLGLGDNSKAALVTRGLAEMIRLGRAMGAQARTFSGLSGLGDLYATCSSLHSRNRAVGYKLGQGMRFGEIAAGMRTVAEGVNTTRAAAELSRKIGVEMPITAEIYRILFEGKLPRKAVEELMLREKKAEDEEIAFEK